LIAIAERGNKRCILHSTLTARRFYRAAGYTEDGPPDGKFGARGGYPMSKPLPPGKPCRLRASSLG
jgi:hypothetical protein